MPNKITDDEIIKALECCGNQMYSCTDKQCKAKTLGNALDLINRQKADYDKLYKSYLKNQEIFAEQSLENERLKAEIERLQKAIQVQEIMLGNQDYAINKAKAENENKNIVYCKDCEYLMFSDFEGECSKAYKGIVRPKDSCPYGKRRKEKNK